MTKRLAVTVIAACICGLAFSAQGAAAGECIGQTDFDLAGGEATGFCVSTTDGGDGQGGGVAPANPAEVAWNSWCGEYGPYVDGAVVGERTEVDSLLATGALARATTGNQEELAATTAQLGADAEAQELTYYRVDCFSAGGSLSVAFVSRGPGGGPAVNPLVLRAAARARVEPPEPTIGTNPPFGERGAVVQLPTWLWVEDPWEPITASESLGGISVSVSATPMKMTWNMGDDNTVVCGGSGVVWQPGLPETATDCSHTYRSSTADEPGLVYNGSASVTWDFSWTLNSAPQGTFGSIDTGVDFTIEVGEIQAISTG